jgi:hypothetical protein
VSVLLEVTKIDVREFSLRVSVVNQLREGFCAEEKWCLMLKLLNRLDIANERCNNNFPSYEK